MKFVKKLNFKAILIEKPCIEGIESFEKNEEISRNREFG